MSEPMPIPDFTKFTYPDRLQRFSVTHAAYLAENPTLSGVIVSAVVVHPFFVYTGIDMTVIGKVLIIQRAATDGFPLLWETPGGGVEKNDKSILSALQRELMEETGLFLEKVVGLLEEGTEWEVKGGRRWRKLSFLVKVYAQNGRDGFADDWEPEVVLNRDEHVDYVWASRDQIVYGEFPRRNVVFAYREGKEIALQGIGLWEATVW